MFEASLCIFICRHRYRINKKVLLTINASSRLDMLEVSIESSCKKRTHSSERTHCSKRAHSSKRTHSFERTHSLRELRTHSSKEDMREVFIYGTFAQGGWVGRRAREGRGLSQVSLQLVVREEGREREGEGEGGGKGRRGREKEGKREKAGERERERERGREKRWNVPWV